MDEKDAKYKIVEYVGRFKVYKKTQRQKGIFKIRLIDEWRSIDILGHPIYYGWQIPNWFKSFKEAKAMVESLRRGRIETYL